MFSNKEYNKIILGLPTQFLFNKSPTSFYGNVFWLMGVYSVDLLIFGISIQVLLLESKAFWESHSAVNLLPQSWYLFRLQRKAWKHNSY